MPVTLAVQWPVTRTVLGMQCSGLTSGHRERERGLSVCGALRALGWLGLGTTGGKTLSVWVALSGVALVSSESHAHSHSHYTRTCTLTTLGLPGWLLPSREVTGLSRHIQLRFTSDSTGTLYAFPRATGICERANRLCSVTKHVRSPKNF